VNIKMKYKCTDLVSYCSDCHCHLLQLKIIIILDVTSFHIHVLSMLYSFDYIIHEKIASAKVH